MLFSSATFLFAFLPVVALLYYLIPKRCTAARNLFLTGASLLFYAWGEPRFVLVMLLVIVSSWLFACKIEASAKSARKGFLLVAVSTGIAVRVPVNGRQGEVPPLSRLGELYLYFCVTHDYKGMLMSTKSAVSSDSMALTAIASNA